MSFLDLQTRAGDVFAAELRQTSNLLLAYAANEQITQLLRGDDQVFFNQAFPRAGTLTAPGWANLWDLLPELTPADVADNGPAGAAYAPVSFTVALRPIALAAADQTSKPAANAARLFLSA